MFHVFTRVLVEGHFLKSVFFHIRQFFKHFGTNMDKPRKLIDKLLSRPLILLLSKRIPIQENKIVFITSRGQFDCNPKWIALELIKRQLPYTLVWEVRKNLSQEDIPNELTVAYRDSYELYQHLASAKIIIDNSISSIYMGYRKKKGQTYIETWHGSLGIKMFSKETNKDKQWVKYATIQAAETDYCLSNSTFEDKIFTDTFWTNSKILQLGHARNDILCTQDLERLSAIRKKVYSHFHLDRFIEDTKNAHHIELTKWYQEKLMQIPVSPEHLDKENPFDALEPWNAETLKAFLRKEYAQFDDLKICLYAPTFRDDGDMRPYEIDYTGLRNALQERFGGHWIIMTRFHFRLLKKLKKYKFPEGVINASDYSDIQELLTCTDVGITDYSSWICDYMLTRHPGFLFATDMAEYEEKDREFFYPLDSMPFPLALDNNQLIENILNFDNETFVKECDEFLKDKGCIDDGHASERIADVIEQIMRGETV